MANCAYCHGDDARGGANGGTNLLRSDYMMRDRDGELMGPFHAALARLGVPGILGLNGINLDGRGLHIGVFLPIGISFYTFATLSYTLDVYLGRAAPARLLRQQGEWRGRAGSAEDCRHTGRRHRAG